MKKLGLIELYMSEWHANNYPQWIEGVCKDLGYDYKVCYAWAKQDVSPVDNVTTAEWSEKYGIEICDTVEELCKKCDNVLILAPSNPETHLELCQMTFKHVKGKRIYIDKTFAPDYATALEIFKLAKENDVKFFSTSALRYNDELKGHTDIKRVDTIGGGSNLDEYIIHQVEMLVKVMGVGATELKSSLKENGDYLFDIKYADGREASITYSACDYEATVTYNDGTSVTKAMASPYFKNLMKAILTFFETGELDFDTAEILEVAKLREVIITSKGKLGEWIKL